MAQPIADLRQGCALLEHQGGQAVADHVGTSIFRLHSRPLQRLIHQRADRYRVGEPGERCIRTNEYATAGTLRLPVER